MPIIEVPAFYIQCDGPAAVPWESQCAAKVSLTYNKEALEKTAEGEGWGAEGRKRFCPQHRHLAPADKPARKARVVDAGASE